MKRGLAALLLLLLVVGALLWLRRDRVAAEKRQQTLSRRAGLVPLTEVEREDAGATVEGRVVDEKGRNLEGALVVALQTFEDARPRPVTLDRTRRGRFRLAGLSSGRFVISATAPGFVGATSEKVQLETGQSRTLELVLRGGGVVLRGTVSDAGGGPIAGARVSAESEGRWSITESDGGGAYELRLLPGRYRVSADADGYAGQAQWLDVFVDQTLPWKLQPAARLRGKVVMAGNGEPVPGAQVQALSKGWDRAECTSGADGVFQMTDVEPGEYLVVAAKGALQGQAAHSVAVGPGAAADDVLVVVERGRTLSGRVLDPAGAPVAGARVRAQSLGRRVNLPRSTGADSGGRWRLEGVTDGAWALQAKAEGFENALLPALNVERDLDGIDLKLGAGSTVSGTVRSDGRAVPGAKVEVHFMGGVARFTIWSGTTDGEGRFRSRAFGRGGFSVHAEAESGTAALANQNLSEGEQKVVELTLSPGEALEGAVHWDDGPPAAHVLVKLFGLTNRHLTARADENGRFRFTRLLPGSVTLSASRDAKASLDSDSEQKTIELPTRDRLELTLPRGGKTLRGTVVDQKDRPVINAGVAAIQETQAEGLLQWERRNTALRARQFTGSDGRFVFEDLSRGTYTLMVEHPQFPKMEKKGVPDGSDVTILLPPGTTLAGVVVGDQPVHDYSIALYRRDEEHPIEETRPVRSDELADPAFEMGGLSPGTWSVCARDRGGRAGCQSGISLGEGEARRDLKVRLAPACTLHGLVMWNGKPGAMAQVRVHGAGIDGDYRTGPDGKFEVRGLAPMMGFEIWAFSGDADLDKKALHELGMVHEGQLTAHIVLK